MKIVIFRHGEKQLREPSIDPEVNRSVCLSEEGIRQIEILADNLYKGNSELIGLKYIYSSPFSRCVQSAEIVRRKLEIKEVKTSIVFKEFYAFNDYSITKDKQKEMHQYALENLDFVNETGYSYKQRAREVMDLLIKFYRDGYENIIISAHGGLIRSLLLIIDNKNSSQYLKTKMPEGGLVKLSFDGNIFSVDSNNN